MHVLATAGHVDHGKSTLVRALTGMEPDRWAEERRRGMTIDLGYAWTTLPSGEQLSFVDVPGHQHFIGNMLAGLGPAPAVLMVVSADGGWQRQSAEHLAAIDALGLANGILAVTKVDLVDPSVAEATLAQVRKHLAHSSLEAVQALAVSARTGEGIDQLRISLDRLIGGLPEPDLTGRIRLWVDRSFTIRGSGTVVTGTLTAGTLAAGDTLELRGELVRIRGLQSLGVEHERVGATARVAVNLRGVSSGDVHRGDALLSPGAWRASHSVDVRLDVDAADLTTELVLHLGTAATTVRIRPLGDRIARLSLSHELPFEIGDRSILRDPGRQRVASGALVLEIDPPPLRRRGAGSRRAADLATASGRPSLRAELERRGIVARSYLVGKGIPLHDMAGTREIGDWLVSEEIWQSRKEKLRQIVDAHALSSPLDPGLASGAARHALELPDPRLLDHLAREAGLVSEHGRVHAPDVMPDLGPAEAGLRSIEARLAAQPFAAPERGELRELGLGSRELAAAANAQRILRLRDDVILLPDAPIIAIRELRRLPQPFTASQARQALRTTRRTAIPLLEYLDTRQYTRRREDGEREVVAPDPGLT